MLAAMKDVGQVEKSYVHGKSRQRGVHVKE